MLNEPCQQAKCERKSQTREQFEALNMHLDKQTKLIEQLEVLLAPVLENEIPKDGAQGGDKIVQNLVSFAASIKMGADAIQRGNSKLASIIQRLHV